MWHKAGMSSAYRLSLPGSLEGVYTAYTYPDRPEGQGTLHVDQYSGRILGDVRRRRSNSASSFTWATTSAGRTRSSC